MKNPQSLIIRPGQLSKLIGVSKVTIWRMEKSGDLPPRVQIGQRLVGWRTSDIDEWIEQLKTPNPNRG